MSEGTAEGGAEAPDTPEAPPMNRAERRAAARKGGNPATPSHNAARPGGAPAPGQRAPGGIPPVKKTGLPRKTGKG